MSNTRETWKCLSNGKGLWSHVEMKESEQYSSYTFHWQDDNCGSHSAWDHPSHPTHPLHNQVDIATTNFRKQANTLESFLTMGQNSLTKLEDRKASRLWKGQVGGALRHSKTTMSTLYLNKISKQKPMATKPEQDWDGLLKWEFPQKDRKCQFANKSITLLKYPFG